MASLGEFSVLKEKFSQTADFVTLYIAEAHPSERGHFTDNYDIKTHPNMAARIEAANTLKEEASEKLDGCLILVDPMDDRANLAYAALPERLYVILDGIIIFAGEPGPLLYDINAVDIFLSKSL